MTITSALNIYTLNISLFYLRPPPRTLRLFSIAKFESETINMALARINWGTIIDDANRYRIEQSVDNFYNVN